MYGQGVAAACGATRIKNRQGQHHGFFGGIRGVLSLRQCVLVSQRAFGADAAHTADAGVVGQFDDTFGCGDADRIGRQVIELGQCHHGAAYGNADHAVRRPGVHGAGVDLTGVIHTGQTSLPHRDVRQGRAAADARRAVVVAVDGERQGAAAAVAIGIGEGVGDQLAQTLARVQCVDAGVVIVQGVAVAAVAIECQVAVGRGKGRAHSFGVAANRNGRNRCGRAVGTQAVSHIIRAPGGKDIASDGGSAVFGDAVGICVGGGHVVHHAYGQRAGIAAASGIKN